MPTAVSESSTNGTTNTEPTETENNAPRTDRMWVALKAHILRERARKRQEHEAEIEEERQRRERERQDVMTLGETREQVSALETQLAQLKEEKHQLFRQLKKVLHEDNNRRRLVKENNEMLTVNMPQVIGPAGMHPQLFLTGAAPGGPQQPGTMPGHPQNYKGTPMAAKRGRSPSPTNQGPPVPPGLAYTQGGSTYSPYKPLQTAPPPQPYQPQKEDSRRHEFVRAVLWNKPSQYGASNQAAAGFYAVPPPERAAIVYYPPRGETGTPSRGPTMYDSPGASYGLASRQLPTHVIPITPAQPASKTGSITAGYPVRSQSVAQYPTQPQSSIYNTGGPPPARPMYSGAPMQGYPPPHSRE